MAPDNWRAMRRKVEIRQEKSQINPTIITMSYGRSVGLSGFRAFDRRVSAAEAFCRVLSLGNVAFPVQAICPRKPTGRTVIRASQPRSPCVLLTLPKSSAEEACFAPSVFPEVVASAANASALKGRVWGHPRLNAKAAGSRDTRTSRILNKRRALSEPACNDLKDFTAPFLVERGPGTNNCGTASGFQNKKIR